MGHRCSITKWNGPIPLRPTGTTRTRPRRKARPLTRRKSSCIAKESLSFRDRKSTRLNSSHLGTSYAVFGLKENSEEQTMPERPTLRESVCDVAGLAHGG